MNNIEYTQDALFIYYNRRISDFITNKQKEAAQKEAFEWLQEYKKSLSISVPWNWKIAKKQIAAYFFGKPPSIQLDYYTDIAKGVDFVKSHPDKNVRCSYHKYDTACHSESRRISSDSLEWLLYAKSTMSERDIIDVFTECSTSSTMCFRRISLQFNEEVTYEMGIGQAMYVFETEQGKHDVAAANRFGDIWNFNDPVDSSLAKSLRQLIYSNEDFLAMKTSCICYFLGIPQISIEGYYDTAFQTQKPMIVDIDLPFDRAFF